GASSQRQYGLHTQQLDMSYQADPAVGFEAAQYLVNQYKDPLTQVQRISFFVPRSDPDVADALLRREISDAIGLQETVTGLTTTTRYFINAVTLDLDDRDNLTL